MKKMLAVVLAALLLGGVITTPALARSSYDELICVLMSTPGVSVERNVQRASAGELEEAIEAGAELIPEDCKLAPERITVLQTGRVSCDEEVYDVSFKVWSTLNRTVGLFFRAEDSGEWKLISCNLGDVIEGRFEASGEYTIVVGW